MSAPRSSEIVTKPGTGDRVDAGLAVGRSWPPLHCVSWEVVSPEYMPTAEWKNTNHGGCHGKGCKGGGGGGGPVSDEDISRVADELVVPDPKEIDTSIPGIMILTLTTVATLTPTRILVLTQVLTPTRTVTTATIRRLDRTLTTT